MNINQERGMDDNLMRTRALLGASKTVLGMSRKDVENYSLFRAIECAARGEQMTGNCIESEAHRAVATALGTFGKPDGIYIPGDVQCKALSRRDLNVASASGGGYLVGGGNVSFVESLRNASIVDRMGALRISGLTSEDSIPRETDTSTAKWLTSETDTPDESNFAFGQIAIAPKTVSSYAEFSRKLVLQANPSVEAVVTRSMGQDLSAAVDVAAINGSGVNGQPLGILGTAGIGSVTGASIDFAKTLEFQTDVLTGKALDLDACGYVTTTTVAALLMARVQFASTNSALWTGSVQRGTVLGMPAMASANMPAATMVFGCWSDLAICEWGVLELTVNPFANFRAGIIGVRAMYSIDVAVRRAASFAAATSIS